MKISWIARTLLLPASIAIITTQLRDSGAFANLKTSAKIGKVTSRKTKIPCLSDMVEISVMDSQSENTIRCSCK